MAPESTKCHLLAIPPELRNSIYALAFEGPSDPVDLTQAKPPSKALLCTCREVYEEGRLLYRAAYREFWSTTKFTLPALRSWIKTKPSEQERLHSFVDAMDNDNVAHIRSIWIVGESSIWVWSASNSVWTLWDCEDTPFLHYKIVYREVWVPKAKLEELGITDVTFDWDVLFGVSTIDKSVAEIDRLMAVVDGRLTKTQLRHAIIEDEDEE